jgi:hypothetical protein
MVGMNTTPERRRAIEAGQWVAARDLSEGAPPTRERVAAALGCNVSSLNVRAAAEGWRRVNFRPVPTRAAWDEFMRVAHAGTSHSGAVSHAAVGAIAGGGGIAEGAAEPAGAGLLPPEEGAVAAGSDKLGLAKPHAAEADWADHDGVVTSAIGAVARAVAAGGAGTAGDDDPADAADEAADDPRAMLARGARFLSRRLSRLMRQAERGGPISKQEIDSLTAMARMMDRWDTLAKERARHEETGRDGSIAEALRKIDRRILTLARAEAERLVAAGRAAGDRGRDQ